MGEFDRYYKDLKPVSRTQLRAANQVVARYNRGVELIDQVLGAIARHVTPRNPPKSCEWIYDEGGKQVVSWQIWRDYEDRYSYNLLADAWTLARVERRYGADVIVRRIGLVPLSRDTDLRQRDIDLSDLYRVVMALVKERRFGLPDYDQRYEDLCAELWGEPRR